MQASCALPWASRSAAAEGRSRAWQRGVAAPHLDVLELQVLVHAGAALDDAEEGGDDVAGAVTHVAQRLPRGVARGQGQ